MALDTKRISFGVMFDLEERGHTPERVARMSPEEAFAEYCAWNGIIGFGHRLFSVAHELTAAATSESTEARAQEIAAKYCPRGNYEYDDVLDAIAAALAAATGAK